MNDRFKFRVWDIEEWTYLKCKYSKSAGYHKYTFGRHNVWQDIGYFIESNPKYYIVEQCTGVKDKNGNLIYEGDVIHEVDKEAEIDDFSQIVWSQGTCHFMKLDLPETGLDRHCILCEEDSPYIEIIGNIHEQA